MRIGFALRQLAVSRKLVEIGHELVEIALQGRRRGPQFTERDRVRGGWFTARPALTGPRPKWQAGGRCAGPCSPRARAPSSAFPLDALCLGRAFCCSTSQAHTTPPLPPGGPQLKPLPPAYPLCPSLPFSRDFLKITSGVTGSIFLEKLFLCTWHLDVDSFAPAAAGAAASRVFILDFYT